MSEVFHRLQLTATGMQRPENMWGDPLSVKLQQRETGEIRPHTLDANAEHELTLTLRVTFWANRAQLPDARKVAERSLATLLYQDVLAKISQIEHAIMDSDGRNAYGLCGELRTMLTR